MSTATESKHTPGPWTYESFSFGSPDAPISHKKIVGPEDSNGSKKLIAEIYRQHASHDADGRLISASPAMFVALAKLICPACEHELQHHVSKEGCEIERGDHGGGEGDYGPYPACAMGPCGCNVDDLKDDYPDFVRALEAFHLAKGESQ